ncbi:hypothetical protein CV945_11325 [Geobacillus sp. Manikaran-105]|nr:hypothetical protein CV945_11325 [Geobacillus sp. Manikaran-105]
MVTFTIQENSHFLYPLCTPTLNDQVQLVVKSQFILKKELTYVFFFFFMIILSINFSLGGIR